MYGLPKNVDLSFFIKKELEQVCFGMYQVIFNFSNNISISVESGIWYKHTDGTNNSFIKSYSKSATLLSSLLSSTIVNAQGQSDGTLTLTFSNNIILEILDDNSQYESYKITKGSDEIIV